MVVAYAKGEKAGHMDAWVLACMQITLVVEICVWLCKFDLNFVFVPWLSLLVWIVIRGTVQLPSMHMREVEQNTSRIS